jgi:Zn-dependent metalloprotease
MKRVIGILCTLAICLMPLTQTTTGAQNANEAEKGNDGTKGKATRLYRSERAGGSRSKWVTAALEQSMAHIKRSPAGKALGLRDPERELQLIGADADDLNQVHVRLQQVVNGVPVYGGLIISKVRGKKADRIYGRAFGKAGLIGTTPTLGPAQAVEAARNALGYTGEFAMLPEAKLVVLPGELVTGGGKRKSGATLTYLVELLVEDGTERTARHFYFIDARDGSVVWNYDALAHADRIGTGHTLYSGRVNFTVDRNFWGNYKLIANDRFGTTTTNMGGAASTGIGTVIDSGDSEFGNYSFNYETYGADVHMAACYTHDYYRFVHGLSGIDGYGYKLYNRVNYGYNYTDAFWNGHSVAFGNGDFSTWYPLITLDIYAHEMTHGVCEKRAGLIHNGSGESGSLHESFSDIFGTSVDMFVSRPNNYLIGEQAFTPFIPGDAPRDLSNPPAGAGGGIDHYSQYSPSRAPHTNGGIQNKAFYLLAEGGTHNGYTVTGVNRRTAELIFFRGLVTGVTGFATFCDSRLATLDAAQDMYGRNSVQFNSTAAAWDSVGVCVGQLPPAPPPDNDNDGWDIYSDCDDNDPFVHPGAPADCSGLYYDRNCNGLSDAGEAECNGGGGECEQYRICQECQPGEICN